MTWKRTLIASAIMISTMVFLNYVNHAENIVANKPFSTFPLEIGKWEGQEDRFDERTYEILGVEDSFLGNYVSPDGRRINLYIGFYQSQRQGDLIHSPRNCMPGSGWNIVGSSFEDITLPGTNPGSIEIARLNLKKGNQRQVVLYWFQSRGRFIASEYMQKIYLVMDSILRQRTDGSFVRLIAPVNQDNQEATVDYMKDFIEVLMPVLEEYIPS